ncbi:MAG TPA: phasin family protein [Aliidongia sp.]|nr:phasin family protein [Aliidongia sp.]
MASQTFNGYDALIALAQSNLDAMIHSSTTFTKISEEIGKEIASQAHDASERVAVASRATLSAKTFQELLDAQVSFATASLDRFLATSTKLSELNSKLALDSVVPITKQVGALLDKAKRTAA